MCYEGWQVSMHDQSWQDDMGRQDVMVYDQRSWQVMFFDWDSQGASVFNDEVGPR